MDDRVMLFRVGTMVLGALIVTVILLVLFGKLPSLIPNRYYTVTIPCENAGGVTKDTPIRKCGILVGRITNVELIDEESNAGKNNVLMTAQIYADKKIFSNEICQIQRDFVGNTLVEIVVDPKDLNLRKRIGDGASLRSEVNNDPTGLQSTLKNPINIVSHTGAALTRASDKLGAASDCVKDILNEDAKEKVKNILDDTAKSLKAFQKILGNEENQQKLADAIKKLPDTIDSMNRTFQKADDTLRTFSTPSEADGRTPIQQMVDAIALTERALRKFSEPSRPGELPPVDQIAQMTKNINEITSLMRDIMTRVDSGDGSLGAFLKDRELYDHINRTVKNIEELSRQLKPIVADARVLSDKMARHPGVLIRDAVKPGVGVK